MKRYRSLKTAMAAMLAAGAIGLAVPMHGQAFAADQQNGKDDAAEYSKLSGAKISLAQAVDAAEKKFGGEGRQCRSRQRAGERSFRSRADD